MHLDVQARGFTLTRGLLSAIHRESGPWDRRADGHRLQVRLFDVNGTRGGVDKGCLVTLHLSGEKRVLIASELDSDLYRAIPSAFEKLRRAFDAATRRARALRRRRAPRNPSA